MVNRDGTRSQGRKRRGVVVGPKMRYALALADRSGGISRLDLARRVGPHGSLCYGYAKVNRLIRAGLVHTFRPDGSRGLWVRTV